MLSKGKGVRVRAWDRILEGKVEWNFSPILCSPLYLFTIVYCLFNSMNR